MDTCRVEGVRVVRIRLHDGTIRELKGVRYVPSMSKNLISVGALESEGLRGTLAEGVLKMSSGSLVVLKGIRSNNLYYLKGSVVVENSVALEQLTGDSTGSCQKVGQVGAGTSKRNSCEHSVLDQKTKVKFAPQFIAQRVFLMLFT